MAIEHSALRFDRLTLADLSPQAMQDEAGAIFVLFLQREVEFGVHPSVAIHYPDMTDRTDGPGLTQALHNSLSPLKANAGKAAVNEVFHLSLLH